MRIVRFLKNKKINFFLLKFFVSAHNFSYRVISLLAVYANHGIHPKHQILKYHNFFIKNTAPDDVILDLGCGRGELSFDLAQKAKEVVAIDNNRRVIAEARLKFIKPNLMFELVDILSYRPSRQFNKIILSNVLEHLDNRIEFLKNIHSWAPIILLRVPLLERDWLSVYKKEMGLEYRLDNTHCVEHTLVGLKTELEASGWRIRSYSIQFGEFWGVISY